MTKPPKGGTPNRTPQPIGCAENCLETHNLKEGSHSNAELADRQNPHLKGWGYTWKMVFLHSLAGRNQGLSSNIFGLTEQDALFNHLFSISCSMFGT